MMLCYAFVLCIGAAVLPSRERGRLGGSAGLDGRTQWRRKTENGCKTSLILLVVWFCWFLFSFFFFDYMCLVVFRWHGCSTTNLGLPFLMSALVLLVWIWRDSYTLTAGRSVVNCGLLCTSVIEAAVLFLLTERDHLVYCFTSKVTMETPRGMY